jgi:hypothetical protein
MAGHLLWPIVLLVVLRFRGPLQESTQAIIMAKNLGLLGATEVPLWNNLRALSTPPAISQSTSASPARCVGRRSRTRYRYAIPWSRSAAFPTPQPR